MQHYFDIAKLHREKDLRAERNARLELYAKAIYDRKILEAQATSARIEAAVATCAKMPGEAGHAAAMRAREAINAEWDGKVAEALHKEAATRSAFIRAQSVTWEQPHA